MSQIAVVLTELELEAVAAVREFVVTAHSGQMRRGGVELMTIKLADVNDNSIMWPEGVWENWESSMLRYTKTKIKLVNALHKHAPL